MSRPLRRWIDRYTPRRVIIDLARSGTPVSRQAVSKWRHGRSLPAPHRIPVLLELSRGELRVDDLVQHRVDRAIRRYGRGRG